MKTETIDKATLPSIEGAIQEHETLHLRYRGASRHVIPLVLGRLRNGREALLCYKITHPDSSDHDQIAFRLYHLSFLETLDIPGEKVNALPAIDYYLTKHFSSVYAKV